MGCRIHHSVLSALILLLAQNTFSAEKMRVIDNEEVSLDSFLVSPPKILCDYPLFSERERNDILSRWISEKGRVFEDESVFKKIINEYAKESDFQGLLYSAVAIRRKGNESNISYFISLLSEKMNENSNDIVKSAYIVSVLLGGREHYGSDGLLSDSVSNSLEVFLAVFRNDFEKKDTKYRLFLSIDKTLEEKSLRKKIGFREFNFPKEK